MVWMMGGRGGRVEMDRLPGGQQSGEPPSPWLQRQVPGAWWSRWGAQGLASCRLGGGARPVLARGLTAPVCTAFGLFWSGERSCWLGSRPWLLVRSLPSLGWRGGGEMRQEEQGGGWVSRGCPPSSRTSQLGPLEVPRWAQWCAFLPESQDSEVRRKSQGWCHLPPEPEAEVPAQQRGGCRWRGGPWRGLLSIHLGVLHHQWAHHTPARWDHLRHQPQLCPDAVWLRKG